MAPTTRRRSLAHAALLVVTVAGISTTLLAGAVSARARVSSAFGDAHADHARRVVEAAVVDDDVRHFFDTLVDAETFEPQHEPRVRAVLVASTDASAVQNFVELTARALGVGTGHTLRIDLTGVAAAPQSLFEFVSQHEGTPNLVVVSGVEAVDASTDGPIHALFMGMASDVGASRVTDGTGATASTGNTVMLFLANLPREDHGLRDSSLPQQELASRARAAVEAAVDSGTSLTGKAFMGRLSHVVVLAPSFDFSRAALESVPPLAPPAPPPASWSWPSSLSPSPFAEGAALELVRVDQLAAGGGVVVGLVVLVLVRKAFGAPSRSPPSAKSPERRVPPSGLESAQASVRAVAGTGVAQGARREPQHGSLRRQTTGDFATPLTHGSRRVTGGSDSGGDGDGEAAPSIDALIAKYSSPELKWRDLQRQCKALGLSQSGRKAALAQRLARHEQRTGAE